ncbi:MAG: CAP domain-containing protein, partial [Pelolinea sp.]|nr:CAP domain-containing protein [Pelolinea sp.]
MKRSRILLLLAVVFSTFLPNQQVQSAAPSSYDLLEAINIYRQSYGLSALETNEFLMVSAQIQSDYLGNTFGSNSPSDWHLGAGGT